MFEYGGNNNFGERFDFFEWSAPYYETPNEVYNALISLNIYNKKITAINSIGAGTCIEEYNLYYIIRDAGVKLGDMWWETYENMNDVLVPWRTALCEPLQLVFEDGMSLEILPFENGGARIGINSIPVGLVDGLNKNSVNTSKLFKELIGKSIESVELRVNTNATKYINRYSSSSNRDFTDTRIEYAIEFSFEYPYKLTLKQDGDSWYEVSAMENERRGKINYRRIKESLLSQNNVQIINGHDSGGTFWIIGSSKNKENNTAFPKLRCFGISIDDYYVYEFLSTFLYKYYDSSIQERSKYDDLEFDWYGVNLYSSDNMKKMIEEIRRTVIMLKEDYDNPTLDVVKSLWTYYQYTNKSKDELTAEEVNELRKNAVPVAIDFYERFCKRIENMLKIPENDIISFAGP